jgi:hypothetical protein
MAVYQRKNLPGTKSLEGYMKKQDKTIEMEDTLNKR